jgi:hypothetical protein
MSPVPDENHVEDMRSYYVGLTRAKRNLYLLFESFDAVIFGVDSVDST